MAERYDTEATIKRQDVDRALRRGSGGRRSWRLPLYLATILASFSLAACSIWTYHIPLRWATVIPENEVVPLSCGENVTQALAFGCTFDFLAQAWLPKACQFPELVADFRKTGPRYYTDPEGKNEIDEEELAQLERSDWIWSSQQEHITHCAFSWRKLHVAMDTGRMIDSNVRSYRHTLHCSMVPLQDVPMDALLTKSTVGFDYCVAI